MKIFLQTVVVCMVLALRLAFSHGEPQPQGSIVGWGAQVVATKQVQREVDPDAGGEVSYTPTGESGQVAADICETIGSLSNPFQFSNRFRGNLYHIVENDVFLREVKMQLAFAGTANFWVSVHKKQLDGSFQEVDINGGSPTQGYIFLGNAQGLGANTAVFYTTGAINNGLGVELTPGDYAIGFAWGPESIKYGRDSSTYPKPLNEGSTLASVSRDVFAGEPPLPSTLPSLTEFTGGAYSMQLCFVPLGGGGACCDTNGADQGCTDNVTEAMCTGPDKVWTNQGQCADQECNCILDCNGATCGDDGCGGSCGTCDDGNPCNGVETCNANRTCVAGTPLNCNDGNVCNGVDTCDPASGCRPGQPLLCDNGVACDGQETCNPSSGCVAGIPVNCDDGLDCTVDSCTEPNGSCTHDDADCSIPTVSEWGLVVLALLLLIGAKVYFGRQAIA